MEFCSTDYGPEVARILSLDGDGRRPLPLVCGPPAAGAHDALRKTDAKSVFRSARHAKAALTGLWLYFSCFEEAHQLADSIHDADGYFWHAIIHRQEPDSGNSAYWFRRVGNHPIFSTLAYEAALITEKIPTAEFRVGVWDPYSYIAFCERAASQPGTDQEQAAREIQLIEWQLLFDHCARSTNWGAAQ